jgi:succinate dehydrogenase flavin-adding protein (antitoxin of CptAB toxin-antitoxin module)
MPKFSEYVETEAELDISVSDFYNELNHKEVQELIDILIEEDYIKGESVVGEESIYEWEFNKMIKKITDNRVMLTAEEDALLKKISDRF